MYGICPKCNKNNILINLYGMPNIAYVEDMERKGVFFNIKGCEPPPAQNAFAYQCKDCEFEFGDLNTLETYELDFSIGSWRDKKDITWNETYIEYKSSPILIPSEEDWKLFWNAVDDLNVWKWEKDYFDQYMLDGTQWELLIKRKGRRKRRIYGSNKYPENFEDFIECLKKLTNNTFDLDDKY